jgi:hypothetical protein
MTVGILNVTSEKKVINRKIDFRIFATFNRD